MKEYLRNLRQRFDNIEHLARFIGVSPLTVNAWQLGNRKPGGVQLRILEVIGVLAIEQPALLAHLADDYRAKKPKPKHAVSLPYIPTMQKPQPPKPVSSKWSDDYWYARTVATFDDEPEIEHNPDMFKGWSEAQIDKYWESCGSYERRTKRFYLN